MGVARHGHNRKGLESPTHTSWAAMLKRCRNPNHTSYKDYGGRGITVCERWLTFENFLADMGERRAGTTLDRKKSDGHYEPDNCRWATKSDQQKNKRDKTNPRGLTAFRTQFPRVAYSSVHVQRLLRNGASFDEIAAAAERGGKMSCP